MKSSDHHCHSDGKNLHRERTDTARIDHRQLGYQVWRENEIVRLELLVTRSVASRSRLLRVHRTVQVERLLFANERQLLRLGTAIATLTWIPFALLEALNAAADAATFALDAGCYGLPSTIASAP